jgi:hypothetical protein
MNGTHTAYVRHKLSKKHLKKGALLAIMRVGAAMLLCGWSGTLAGA